jgi:acetyl esterase
VLIEALLRGLSNLGKLHPYSRRLRQGVKVARNLRYGPGSDDTFDVYRHDDFSGPRPVLIYIHGGGFRILSKDTHWMFGQELARRGFVVFSINYRLALPFSAALEDAARAVLHIHDVAEAHGGDLKQLVYAGESAGANLTLALAILHSWRREEHFAAPIFNLPHRPRVILPACGMLEVHNPERYLQLETIPVWIRDRIKAVCEGYLPEAQEPEPSSILASPLRFLESAAPPERPMPAVFAGCGTRDPVMQDTVRLGATLSKLGVEHEVPLYEGGLHSFHALVWSALAQAFWQAQDAFLARHHLV